MGRAIGSRGAANCSLAAPRPVRAEGRRVGFDLLGDLVALVAQRCEDRRPGLSVPFARRRSDDAVLFVEADDRVEAVRASEGVAPKADERQSLLPAADPLTDLDRAVFVIRLPHEARASVGLER